MHVILSFASGIVCLVAYVPYILNILKGHTKPERMSWLLWLILGVISFFAQASLGATFSLVLPAVLTLGSLTIFILSIKYGIGGTLRRDIVALVVSMSGLGVWILYNKPLVSLLINIAIGSVSALLTMFKAREHPNTETSLTWLLTSIAGLLSLSSVKNLEFSLVAYPTYIVITNFAVYVSTARK